MLVYMIVLIIKDSIKQKGLVPYPAQGPPGGAVKLPRRARSDLAAALPRVGLALRANLAASQGGA